MFGYPPIGRGLSLAKILGGISKTLNVANQIIPIYHKARPIVSNARNLIGAFKNINITDNINNKITSKETKMIEAKKEPINGSTINNPNFFI